MGSLEKRRGGNNVNAVHIYKTLKDEFNLKNRTGKNWAKDEGRSVAEPVCSLCKALNTLSSPKGEIRENSPTRKACCIRP